MIYKYASNYFGRGLAQLGLYRIGTLGDYRRAEHADGIADSDEGIKTIKVDIDDMHYASGENFPINLGQLGLISVDETSTNITLEKIHTTIKLVSPDAYIWCASSMKSAEVMGQFEGADTCVEIFDLERFFAVLNQCMWPMNVTFQGLFEVKYTSKIEAWHPVGLGDHPALLKHISYQGQHEVRAIWTPNHDGPIEPKSGRWDGLAQCCRVVSV